MSVGAVAGALGLWDLLIHVGVLSPSSFPTVGAVVSALADELRSAAFYSALWTTVRAWAIGLAVSAALAVPIGLILGLSARAYLSTRLVVDFLRNIPPLAILPLVTLLYGTGLQAMLIMVVAGAGWPLLLQTIYGVRDIDPVMRDTALSYRLPRWSRVRNVAAPTAAPFIATGVRISATIALLIVVGTELITGNGGLGSIIAVAQEGNDLPGMYAYIAVTGILGVPMAGMLATIERRLLRWHPAFRPGAA